MRLTLFLLIAASISFAAPAFDFQFPTPADGTILYRDYFTINASVADDDLGSFMFSWNGTNYSFYDDSLVLSLSLDENHDIGEDTGTAVDISRHGNNGVTYGALVSEGVWGRAMSFDGTTYISLGTSDSLKVENASFSVEFWFQPYPAMINKTIMSSAQSNYLGYSISINSVANGSVDLAKSGVKSQPVIYPYGFEPYRWYHLVAVQHFAGSAPSYVEYFINGEFAGNYSDTSPYNPSTGYEGRIGTGYSGNNNYQGLLDEVRVYSRALSAQEVKMHYYSSFYKDNSTQFYFASRMHGVAPGTYSYYAAATNSSGSLNVSEARTLSIYIPIVAITSPLPTTYPNTTSIQLAYSVTSRGVELSSCWYSLDGGDNYSLPFCDGTTLPVSEGMHTLSVYAMNTEGGIGSSSVRFVVGSQKLFSCGMLTYPGPYRLENDVNYSEGNCFEIDSDNVSLDLGGHFVTCAGNCSAAVRILSSSNVSVSEGSIEGGSAGILYDNGGTPLHGLSLSGILFENLNSSILLNGAAGVSVSGNSFYNTGVALEADSIFDFIVENNYAENAEDGIRAISRPGSIPEGSSCYVRNNTIRYPLGIGMEIAHYGYCYIDGNTVEGSGASGIVVRAEGSSNASGLYRYMVRHNNVSGMSQAGISLSDGASNSTFRNNTVSGCGDGFSTDPYAKYNLITENFARFNGLGFNVRGSANLISNNSACLNSDYGFYFANGSELYPPAQGNSGSGNRGDFFDASRLNSGFSASVCLNRTTIVTLSLKNSGFNTLYLESVSLDGNTAAFAPPVAFNSGERKTVSFELPGSYCAQAGQLVQFDSVIFSYREGALGSIAQAGTAPLIIVCS